MVKKEKERFVRISALLWADILVAYALFVMQNYLTEVWGISLNHAALILNIWNGVYRMLPVFFLYLVHEFLGNFKLLVVTSLSYTAGITMVAVSTPPLAHATGTCKRYQPECVGTVADPGFLNWGAQKGLLIAGLALIAVGVAGNLVSVKPFILQQKADGSSHASGSGKSTGRAASKAQPHQLLGMIAVMVVGLTGAIALPYIRPRTLKFGIPAICTAFGTFLFLTGSCGYKKDREVTESPLCIVCRVLVAASLKSCQHYPDANDRYHGYSNDTRFTHTRCLRGLHKAAIILPDDNPQRSKSWTLCTVAEVEETKIAVRMVPMWMTFVVCGIVAAIGDTYFVEQAGKLNRNIGKLRLPIQVLLLARKCTKYWIGCKVEAFLMKENRHGSAPSFGIGAGMICSVLCCISAALVEGKRLDVVRSHGLVEQPDAQIKMSVYWLLFQFVLLGGLDSFLEKSVSAYYRDQSPESMQSYLVNLSQGVTGLGYMCSAVSVYVVGKISERRGKTNWFQHTLNRSRLDRYYWVLAGLSAANLVVFVFVALFYRYKKPIPGGREGPDAGDGYTDGYTEGDQNRSCPCFC